MAIFEYGIELHLFEGHILKASIWKDLKEVRSTVDLNQVLGINDGYFRIEAGGNFIAGSRNEELIVIKPENGGNRTVTFMADLKMDNGDYRVCQTIDLDYVVEVLDDERISPREIPEYRELHGFPLR